jgi:uncharacterized delta-60 repeat protein
MTILWRVLFPGFGLVAAISLAAQVAGSLDTNFVQVAGSDTFPKALAAAGGGRLYVGGAFTNYGGTGRGGLARLTATGAMDAGFNPPTLLSIVPPVIFNGQVLVAGSTNAGTVSAILVLGNGRLVVAGSFSHVNGAPAPGVVVLEDAGSVATASLNVSKIEPGALLPGPGGTFYLGGKGSVDDTRLPLLRLFPDGTRDTGFEPPTLAALGYASASALVLLSGPGDTLYVVTAAATPAFTPTFDILRLTAGGGVDTGFADAGKAAIPNPSSSGMASTSGGQLVFSGLASYRGATLNRKINRLALDGTLDPTFNIGIDPGAATRVVGVQADGKVLYYGSPNPVNRLNADGSVDTGYANPAKVPVNQTLMALLFFTVAPDQSVYAGGYRLGPSFNLINGAFHVFGDPPTGPTVVVEPAGQTNTLGARTRFSVQAQGAAPLGYQWFRNGSPIPGATGSDLILPVTVSSDDADYRCTVSNAQGSVATRTVRLTLLAATPGSAYRETDVPIGPNAAVTDLDGDASAGLIGVGGFTTWNGTNRVRVARLLPGSSQLDTAFDTSGLVGTLGLFEQVLPLDAGRGLVVGNFTFSYSGRDHREVARLNANGSVDVTFNPNGSGGSGIAGGTSTRPVATLGGKVLLYGSRWNDEDLGGSYFRLNPDGTRDVGFALRGTSYLVGRPALAALPDGRCLVAGAPPGTALPGGGTAATRSGVLRLRADGTLDPTFDTSSLPNSFNNAAVHCILVQPDGRILVGGLFSVTSGPLGVDTVNLSVIRLLPDGQPDPGFNRVPRLARIAGLPGIGTRRLALQADGRILAAGSTDFGAFPRSQIARFWPSGPQDPDFQVGSNLDPAGAPGLLALAVGPDNAIFVGGEFKEWVGLPRTNFARLNGGPLEVTPPAPTVASVPLRVVAKVGTEATLTVAAGGVGPFQYQWRRNQGPGATNFHDIIDATNATLMLPGLKVADSGLLDVSVVNPGGAATSPHITLLVEPDPAIAGQVDGSFAATAFQGNLSGLSQIAAAVPDGKVYGLLGDTVVRLFEDGTRDFSFSPPPLAKADPYTLNGIAAILLQPDGKLLVAGRLAFDGGPCNVPGATCFEPKRGLVRLLPDGSLDPDFVQTNAFRDDAQNLPQMLGLQSDGKILVAGGFGNFAGRTATGLVRLRPNGEFDDAFPHTGIDAVLSNPPRVVAGRVLSVHVLGDDRIYIGGGFNRVQGVARHGVARLNADGTLDTTFEPPTNGATGTGTAGSLLFHQLGPVTPQGGVHVFGEFHLDGAPPLITALRLRLDGSSDPTFRGVTDYQINSGAVQADGKLIVSGQFTRVDGVAWGNLARLNLDGTLDTTFESASTGTGVGGLLSLLADGKLLAGSRRHFTGVGPALPSSALQFTLTPGGLEFSWASGFKLQRTMALVPASWVDVAVDPPFTAPLAAPNEFYRAIAVP